MNDGRATSTCSLGPLISAEIAAADSLQENGLVKYKGNAELSGIFRPALGTIVTFEYTMDGVTRTVPKKMRVLSSFANPLTRTTSVELGCLLTYKADLREPEKIDTELANTDYSLISGSDIPDKYPALGSSYSVSWGATAGGGVGVPAGYWAADYKRVGASISAAWALKYCLEKLAIASSSIPLTNTFRMQEFDFSAGWVQVISDLLQSESYIGELDFDEVMQIRSLTDDSTTGPVVLQSDLINVAPINAGGIPPNALGVQYSAWRFNSTPDPNQSPISLASGSGDGTEGSDEDETVDPEDTPGWEYSSQTGPVAYTTVNWENAAKEKFTYTGSYLPETVTKTEYGVVAGKRVQVSSNTRRSSILSAEAPEYLAAQLKSGSSPDYPVAFVETSTTEYYSNGERKRDTTLKYVPAVTLAGATNLDFWYPEGVLQITGGTILTERITVDYYPAANREAQVTTKWLHWLNTQPGQQAAAGANERIKTLAEALSFASQSLNSGLYLMGQSVDTTVRSVPTQGDDDSSEPGPTDKANQRLGGSSFSYLSEPSDGSTVQRDEQAEIEWIFGDADEERRTTISMPYNADDEVIPNGIIGGWTLVRSTAQEKALRYGRVQNRLTYGYRNGMEIQMTPWKMPGHAFAPLYISIDGLVAQYRVNNPSWVLTAGEAVASCNAIYWGVVGTT